MRAFPLLNQSDIAMDAELLDQVLDAPTPYDMAFPLARVEDRANAAMEYSDNVTAVAILSRLLGRLSYLYQLQQTPFAPP